MKTARGRTRFTRLALLVLVLVLVLSLTLAPDVHAGGKGEEGEEDDDDDDNNSDEDLYPGKYRRCPPCPPFQTILRYENGCANRYRRENTGVNIYTCECRWGPWRLIEADCDYYGNPVCPVPFAA